MIENSILGIIANNPELLPDSKKYLPFLKDNSCKRLYQILDDLHTKHGTYTRQMIVEHIVETKDFSLQEFEKIYNDEYEERKYKPVMDQILTRNMKQKLYQYSLYVREKEYKNLNEIKCDIIKFVESAKIIDEPEIIDSKKAAWILLEMAREQKPIPKIVSGFSFKDEFERGYDLTDYIVMGAGESVGKTAKMIDLVASQLKSGMKICFVTREMPALTLYKLLACNLAGINNLNVDNNCMTEEEKCRYTLALDKLYQFPIFIIDNVIFWTDIKNEIKKMKDEYNIDMVYIDYLQRLKLPNDKRGKNREYDDLLEISESIKENCHELKIPHFAASSIVKEGKNGISKVEHLRGHGQMANDFDVAIMLNTIEKAIDGNFNKRLVNFIFEKNRNGRQGELKQVFECPVRRFKDWKNY